MACSQALLAMGTRHIDNQEHMAQHECAALVALHGVQLPPWVACTIRCASVFVCTTSYHSSAVHTSGRRARCTFH